MPPIIQYGNTLVHRMEANQDDITLWDVFSQIPTHINDLFFTFYPKLRTQESKDTALLREFMLYGMLEASNHEIHDPLFKPTPVPVLGKLPHAAGKYNINDVTTAFTYFDGTVYIRPSVVGVDRHSLFHSLGYPFGDYPIPRYSITEKFADPQREETFMMLAYFEAAAQRRVPFLPIRDADLPTIILPGSFLIPGGKNAGELILHP